MKWIIRIILFFSIALNGCQKEDEQAIDNFSVKVEYDAKQGVVTISPQKEFYCKNDLIVIKAVPNSGYEFVKWIRNESVEGETETTIEHEVASDVNITALFRLIENSTDNRFKLNVNFDSNIGTVSVEPQKAFYQKGDQVKLKATPNNESIFEGWSGDIVNVNSEQSIVIDKDYNVNALFKKKAQPNASIVLQINGSYNFTSKKWGINVELQNCTNGINTPISDALVVIKANAIKYNSVLARYDALLSNLEPESVLEISITKEGIKELKYSIVVPPTILSKDFQYSKDDKTVNITWQPLSCSGYRIFRKFSSTNGAISYEEILNPSIFTQNNRTIQIADLWDVSVATSPLNPISKCLIWVTAVNRIENIEGLHSDSYIDFSGKPSTGLELTK